MSGVCIVKTRKPELSSLPSMWTTSSAPPRTWPRMTDSRHNCGPDGTSPTLDQQNLPLGLPSIRTWIRTPLAYRRHLSLTEFLKGSISQMHTPPTRPWFKDNKFTAQTNQHLHLRRCLTEWTRPLTRSSLEASTTSLSLHDLTLPSLLAA